MNRDQLLFFGVTLICFSCHENQLWSLAECKLLLAGLVTWITKYKCITVLDMIKIGLATTKTPPSTHDKYMF